MMQSDTKDNCKHFDLRLNCRNTTGKKSVPIKEKRFSLKTYTFIAYNELKTILYCTLTQCGVFKWHIAKATSCLVAAVVTWIMPFDKTTAYKTFVGCGDVDLVTQPLPSHWTSMERKQTQSKLKWLYELINRNRECIFVF